MPPSLRWNSRIANTTAAAAKFRGPPPSSVSAASAAVTNGRPIALKRSEVPARLTGLRREIPGVRGTVLPREGVPPLPPARNGRRMRRRSSVPPHLAMRHLATILVFVLAGGVLAAKVVSGNEPRLYGGRTPGGVDDRIKAFSYSSREAAEAVPALIEIVSDAAAPGESRRQAALTLGRMGRPAVEAVPVLIRLAGPPSTEETRLWALSGARAIRPARPRGRAGDGLFSEVEERIAPHPHGSRRGPRADRTGPSGGGFPL